MQQQNPIQPSQTFDDVDLSELLSFLAARKTTILAFIVVAVLLTALYIFITPPIYQANTLLQVELQEKGLPGLEALDELLGESSTSQAEIEIIRSRSILGEAVKDLQLDLKITPSYFPLIGSTVARRYAADSLEIDSR